MKNFEKYKNQIIEYYQKNNVTLGVAIVKVQKEVTKKEKSPLESFKWLYEEANDSILDSTEKRIIREMLLEFSNKEGIYIRKRQLDAKHKEIAAEQVLSTLDYSVSFKTEEVVVTGTLFDKMEEYKFYTLKELGL